MPRHHKAAICKCYHPRTVAVSIVCLVSTGHAVDQELTSHRRTRPIVALGVHPITGAVLAIGRPAEHKATVLEPYHRRHLLVTRGVGVDPKLGNRLRPVGIEDTRPDIPTTATVMARTVVITPGHYKTARLKTHHRGLILAARYIAVHPELRRHLCPVRIEDSRPDIVAGANPGPVIVAAALVITPAHHKTTI